MSERIQVKQRYVGWLLGKGGSAIAEVEKASGCQIFVNQETKALGHSVVQLVGTDEQRYFARQAIEASIAKAKVARESLREEERLEIEQRWVGWLLGKKGGLVQEIEQETGAQIKIDQSTSHLNYSTVVLTGSVDQVDDARDRVNASLEKAGAVPMAPKVAPRAAAGLDTGASVSRGSSCNVQVTVEQQWVGWLLGKGGAAVKDIEATAGAKIAVNQDTKDQGYSTIALSGTPLQIHAAYDAMTESLRRAGGFLSELPGWLQSTQGSPRAPSSIPAPTRPGPLPDLAPALLVIARAFVAETGPAALGRILPLVQDALTGRPELAETLSSIAALPPQRSLRREERRERSRSPRELEVKVDQSLVGWLCGSRGHTVQKIEEETGARVLIDQSTKTAGYSIVRVSGSPSAVQQAEKRIQASLAMVNKEASLPNAAAEKLEMQVDQRLVGWILGRSGSVLREILAQSGAKVSIDQTTKELGFSTVRISGSALQCQVAKQLIEVKIKEANTQPR